MPFPASVSTRASLLAAIRETPNDPQLWSRFVQRYRPAILDICKYKGLQDAAAEDVTQCVLVKLFSFLHRFEYDPEQRFRHWLRKVTLNALVDELRRYRHCAHSATELDFDTFEDREASASLNDAIEAEYLEWALANLRRDSSPEHYQVFEMYRLQGLAPAVVSERAGTSVSQVYVISHRLEKKLKALAAADLI